MHLDWDTRITDLCDKLGFDPELYNEDEEFMEWVAKYFGFKDYKTFLALASPKDILGGMALEMLPGHKNFEFYLLEDCTTLIGHNYDLYDDEERTLFEIENFLTFIAENFSDEMIIVALTKLPVNAESIKKFLPHIDTHAALVKQYSRLAVEV